MAANDAQWLASQSADVLAAYIKSGDSICLMDLPPHSHVSIDSRTYSQAITHIHGLSPTSVHLVTLSLAAPTNSIAIFLPPMRCGHAVVRYDDAAVALSVTHASVDPPPPVGSRGVGVLPAPARADWDALAGKICAATLAAAQITLSRCTEAPKFEPWPRTRPPTGATGEEITRFGMDASPRVLDVMQSRYGGRLGRLVGELQLAFVGFVFMGCTDSLTHWTRIVKEVCGCFSLFEDTEGALAQFADMLAAQLRFVDHDVRDAFKGLGLRTAMRRFWEAFKDRIEDASIGKWLATGDGDEESDEDGPTVVDMNLT